MLFKQKKWILVLLSLPLVFFLSAHDVRAGEYHFDGSDMSFGEILDQLPSDLKDELDTNEMDTPTEAVETMMNKLTISYWMKKLTDEFCTVFFPSIRTASVIVGLLIIFMSS